MSIDEKAYHATADYMYRFSMEYGGERPSLSCILETYESAKAHPVPAAHEGLREVREALEYIATPDNSCWYCNDSAAKAKQALAALPALMPVEQGEAESPIIGHITVVKNGSYSGAPIRANGISDKIPNFEVKAGESFTTYTTYYGKGTREDPHTAQADLTDLHILSMPWVTDKAEQPDELPAVLTRWQAACKIVSDLCRRRDDPNKRDWIMSIPARPDYDPDLVIYDSLKDIPCLVALLQQRRAPEREIGEQDCHHCGKLRDGLKAANDMNRRLIKRSKWQPIETAPKDGTEITGGWASPFNDYSGTPICWQKGDTHEGWFLLIPHPWSERFILGTYPGRWIKEVEYPTHWMPKLPEPKRNDVEDGEPDANS